ncbi:MAG: hypothetical protein CL912_31065 [Deltaproteobacteria bacterium]|nr:hypothetical protein [Deltaproteobacteria bacterium]
MSSQPARAWGPATASPPRRIRAQVARKPFRTLSAPLQKHPQCWIKYPSHAAAASTAANRAPIIRRSGGIGGQKRRQKWRNGERSQRLTSRLSGRDEVGKDGNENWVYV